MNQKIPRVDVSMQLVSLTEFLVKNIAKEKELVSVKQFADVDDFIVIQVMVDSSDMGAVIGKGGCIANAIRTLVQASAYINDSRRVRINIDSF